MRATEDRLRQLSVTGYENALSRFAQTAFPTGGAEVAYGAIPSPIGTLLAVVTRRGLLALAFESEDQDHLLETVSAKVSPAIVDLPSATSDVRTQLDAYFTGALRLFDLPLDRSLITPYQDKVLTATSGIPSGETRSYAQVAAEAGRPKGARATGQALGANPIPIVIPCHRVIASDGSLRGYAGGLPLKEFLLNHEKGTLPLF